jgi:hypothetical protein
MPADKVQAIADKVPVFYGTIAPGECLYTPVGFVISETVSSDKDVLGTRLPLLFHAPWVKEELQAFKVYMAKYASSAHLAAPIDAQLSLFS